MMETGGVGAPLGLSLGFKLLGLCGESSIEKLRYFTSINFITTATMAESVKLTDAQVGCLNKK
jgi:hypothetical protein